MKILFGSFFFRKIERRKRENSLDVIMEKKRHSFSGSIGFVLAAAGSAVGL